MEPQGGQEPRSEGSGESARPEQPAQPGSWPPPPAPPQYPPAGAGWPPPADPGGSGLPGTPGAFPGAGGPAGPGAPPPWGAPGGPAGPPPWGGPAPYGFGPPPRPKRNAGLVLGLIGGGVLLVLLVVVGAVAFSGSGEDDPKKTSGKAAAQAGSALGGAPGLALSGTYAGGRASFTVTKAGTARGSYTAAGSDVGRVDIGGTTYLKAGKGFWTAQGVSSTRADKADGTWTKAPEFAVELNLSDLSPARLAQVLQQAGNDPLAEKTPVNGVPTIKMSAGGRKYYITVKKPYRLVRIEGNSGPNRFSFDVKALAAPEMSPIFTALRTDVRALTNAYDPEVSVAPVGSLKFGSCGEPGCTVSVAVRPAAEESASSIRLSMNVRFRGTGGTVSTCTDTATTKAGAQKTLSCRTSGGKWSSWYRSHNGRFTIHATAKFAATVNSTGDVNALLQKLSQEQQGG